MASSLPNNPSLDRLRAEARTLQRAAQVREQDAVAAVSRNHPRPDAAWARQRFALHDAQLTVARGYGFAGWPALVRYLGEVARLGVDPSQVDEASLEPADRFCTLAVLHYDPCDAPPRWAEASEILSAEPDLVDVSVWSAAAAADPRALARHLGPRPGLVATRGGPLRWSALTYLCYSRIPTTRDDVLSAAGLLLDAGADPNDGFLWCGLSTPFTALTGVLGEGEQGVRRQPRHPFAPELAALLLQRGAHPVDHQALYNRMVRSDDTHLELLFAHGLADAGPSPWERRLGSAMETREQMWRRQIDWAAAHGFADRLELLARQGIDTSGAVLVPRTLPDDPNMRDDDGATPLHHAAWDGDVERIEFLLAAGADPSVIEPRFGATARGWAEHAYQAEAAELLRRSASPSRRIVTDEVRGKPGARPND